MCVSAEGARCTTCERAFERRAGIWRCLLEPEQYEAFLEAYRRLRAAEGWGSTDASYYLALPEVGADDPQRAIWRRRAQHFAQLLRVLPQRVQRVLDAGAGNGWLAYQLAQRGHHVAALDISDDARDGLGAHVHYPAHFECYQAEFERLPFGAGQFDWVIYNGALHYVRTLVPALAEARRVLRTGGHVVVMDSPFFTDAASSEAMVAEQERRLYGNGQAERYLGYLTRCDVERAAREAGLRLTKHYAKDGWRLLRAWTARRVGREPASFPIVVME